MIHTSQHRLSTQISDPCLITYHWVTVQNRSCETNLNIIMCTWPTIPAHVDPPLGRPMLDMSYHRVAGLHRGLDMSYPWDVLTPPSNIYPCNLLLLSFSISLSRSLICMQPDLSVSFHACI